MYRTTIALAYNKSSETTFLKEFLKLFSTYSYFEHGLVKVKSKIFLKVSMAINNKPYSALNTLKFVVILWTFSQ